MNLLKKYLLENGLEVKVFDKTYRYFADYFTVLLELKAEVEVREDYFDTNDMFKRAKSLLGEKQNYIRELKREGVYEKDVENVKEELLSNFERHSINYLSRSSFLKKFILKRLKEEERKAEIERLRTLEGLKEVGE